MADLSDTPRLETPTERLARSLFGFGVLAALVGVVAWLGLLAAPVSPDAAYAQLRTIILVGFGLLVLLLIALTSWSLMAEDERLHAFAQPIARWLRSGWVAAILVIVALELNFVAVSALRDVAPAIVAPLRLALAGWSLVLLLVIGTVQWAAIQQWFQRTARTWAALGLTVIALAGLAVLFVLTTLLVQASGVNDRLRGQLDYRELVFIDDGQSPSSTAYFTELSQTRVRWEPYVYWVVAPFSGQYIHVRENGLRDTYQPETTGADAPVIGVFGGSTVWGEGARDRYTIPSQLATLLTEAGQPARVINYGQTGYVSTQDLLMFQAQLLQGQPLKTAIFYGGFNDVLSAYAQDATGLTLQEADRLSDSESGRLLRAGQPVLRPVTAKGQSEDYSLMAIGDGSAESIVARYLANVRMIAALGAAYDVQVVFVWQPALAFKQNPVGGEVGAQQRMETERAGFATRYQQVDELLRAAVASDDTLPPFILLSDLFNGDERALFYDLIHITETGNLAVATHIRDALLTAQP